MWELVAGSSGALCLCKSSLSAKPSIKPEHPYIASPYMSIGMRPLKHLLDIMHALT